MKQYYVWGTGKLAMDFYFAMHPFMNIVGFVETIPTDSEKEGKKVYSPDEIENLDSNFVLVVNRHFNEICYECNYRGILKDRLIDVFNVYAKVEFTNGQMYVNYDYCCSPEENWLTWNYSMLCTDKREILNQIISRRQYQEWWNLNSENVILGFSNQLENNQKKYIDEELIPSIKGNEKVLDIGCSNGRWDEYVSKYVQNIYAFDYSDSSISYANKRKLELGINNIQYEVGDALTKVFESNYDIIMMLGVLIYFDDDVFVRKLLERIYNALKVGGKVIIRDSVNMMNNSDIFHYNFNNNYQAMYREKKSFEKMWASVGFKKESERILATDLCIGQIKKYSIGYIFEK